MPDERLDADFLALQRALVGRYALERELGRGGMATVYLARDIARDRLIALKLLRAGLTRAAGDDRFLREIRILAKLQHPNILSLHDSGILDVEDGVRLPFYTMPYVEGESLRERLQGDRKPSTAEAVRIVREIADALAAAHAAGVVHRDLKPENVLLSQGHAMVSDFGIAKAMSTSVDLDNLTATGIVLGTPAYMAPEQSVGDPEMDHRADLYSLGVIAYELLTGGQPFGARTPQQMLVAHATMEPESIEKRAPKLDPALGELVMRLLEKSPSDRPQSAADVLVDLDAIAAGTAVRRRVSGRVVTTIVALVAIAAIGASAAWLIQRSRARVGTGAAAGALGASVAVLPFDNLSGDQQRQYFSDGMSEQIMYALGKVEGLRVSPRTSAFAFRGRGAAFREIGSQLHVAHVIEGSVRQSGNRLRVNVQLINVASGNADWSEEYQRDVSDVFQVQDDIARAIVGALRVRLTSGAAAPLMGAGTRSVEAYDLYLKGRYFYERRTEQDFLRAAGLFKQAIEKDPSYARAYAGLSDTYALLGIFGFAKRDAVAQLATEAVTTALRLDSTSAEAFTSLGIIRLFYDWDWPGAQRALERAIALDPRYVPARLFHAWYFVAVNQLDSALSEAQRGAELDPLSIIMRTRVATMLQYAGRQVEALAVLQRTLALDSTYELALSRMAISSVAVNRCDDALRAIAGVHHPGVTSYVGYVLASCHRQAEARALALDLERHFSQSPATLLELAAIYAALREKDKAFAWLERAYTDHSWPLFQIRVDLAFESLRSDPPFQAIVRRMRFP